MAFAKCVLEAQIGASRIPAAYWRAVEAVLTCRTPRLGGHRYECSDCTQPHYVYHSCNHPQCGGHDQQVWAAKQIGRLLPVPYYMITPTVPNCGTCFCAPLRRLTIRSFVPHTLFAQEVRDAFSEILLRDHPALYNQVDPEIWRMKWNVNARHVGRGKTALRYVAAYVAKSAFNESRLGGYDTDGKIRLWCTPSKGKRRHCLKLKPAEFIRRWLLHVLPRRFVRLRYYGFLSAAAKKAFARVRFLLGVKTVRVELPYLPPMCCSKCEGELVRIQKIHPARGPPLSLGLIHQASIRRKKHVS